MCYVMFTRDEVEIVNTLCLQVGWDTDISENCDAANIGHFYVEKHYVKDIRKTIGGEVEVDSFQFILYEEVVEHNYPHEPDWSDSVEFDSEKKNIYDVMARLLLREKEYEIDNLIEGYAMHREFIKSQEYKK